MEKNIKAKSFDAEAFQNDSIGEQMGVEKIPVWKPAQEQKKAPVPAASKFG